MKKLTAVLCALCLLLCCGGCSGKANRFTIYETFDTVIDVIVYTGSADAEKYGQMAKTELLRYHKLCDAYHPYAGVNGVYEINHAGGKWVTVEKDLADILHFGMQAYQKTDGVVNLLGGAVTTLWKDTAVPPDKTELLKALKHIDINALQIDGNRVRLTDAAAKIDVGAFAKGYALEKTADKLRQNGFCGILSATSSIVTVGDKNGEPFSVAIGNPTGGQAQVLSMRELSLSTSGIDQRFFEYKGKRFHHIIDLSTGCPADSEVIQASVVDRSAAWCDVYSTAALILGKTDKDGLLYYKDGTSNFTGDGKQWHK